MKRALVEIRANRISIRKAAIQYEIPYGTLQDRLKGRFEAKKMKLGRKAVFSEAQEAEIASTILELSNAFYGLTPTSIRELVYVYAERNRIPHRFNVEKKKCGKDWLYSFMQRHHELSFRKPEATSLNRITAFNRTEVDLFFNNLESLYDRFKFESHRIFNVDETGISNVHNPGRIVAKKGQKQVGAVTSGERGQTTTVVCALSASGQYIPPLFIFKRKRMKDGLDKNGPVGAIYKCSESGWITEELFCNWLEHFQKHVNATKEQPVLLVLDNHSTHSSLNSYNFCRDSGIHIVSLPPHTSHRLQPLDITFFGPLKAAYHQECDRFIKNKSYEKINQTDIAELFRNAFNRAATIEKAVNGFRTTGIFPLNRFVFSEEELIACPSEIDSQEGTNLVAKNTPPLPNVRVTENLIGIPGPSGIKNIRAKKSQNMNCISSDTSASEVELESVFENSETDDDDRTIRVKRKQKQNTSFKELCPLPTHYLRINNRRRQHSKILTATPLKEELEKKEVKKEKKKDVEKVKRNMMDKEEKVKSCFGDVKKKKKANDICSVCDQFGSNGEIWWRCRLCGLWAHAACTDANSASQYKCEICVGINKRL